MEKAMNLTHEQLMATLYQVVHDEGPTGWSPAETRAYGFGYMASWLAGLARKHPAVLQELMRDPRFIRARQSLENAG
jgi:hypothetical protein